MDFTIPYQEPKWGRLRALCGPIARPGVDFGDFGGPPCIERSRNRPVGADIDIDLDIDIDTDIDKTTRNWAYNLTSNLPNWPYISVSLVEQGTESWRLANRPSLTRVSRSLHP